MPKVRASSTRIGTTRGPRSLSRSSCVRKRTKACVVEISRPSAVGSSTALKVSSGGTFELLVGLGAALRQVAAERLAPLVQVLHLRRVVGRLVERDVGELVVGDRDVEAVAEAADVVVDQLLGLVRGVLALAALAHAEALDGLDQQHGRLALVVDGAVEGGVDLLRIVAAAAAGARCRRRSSSATISSSFGCVAEEVLAHEGAVVGLHRLVVAVDRVHHHLAQRCRPCRARAADPSSCPRSA